MSAHAISFIVDTIILIALIVVFFVVLHRQKRS